METRGSNCAETETLRGQLLSCCPTFGNPFPSRPAAARCPGCWLLSHGTWIRCRESLTPSPQRAPSPTSFLGLPLGFLPGAVVVFLVFAAPLFLLPFGRPRGLFGVGTSLGSFWLPTSAVPGLTGGCLRGLPRPRFSVPSFSCLEAKGWLDFALDSLIFPSLRSRWKSDSWDARARPPACGARSGLLRATVLGAGDRPGSAAAAAAGSKCGCLLGAAPAPEIAPARSPN